MTDTVSSIKRVVSAAIYSVVLIGAGTILLANPTSPATVPLTVSTVLVALHAYRTDRLTEFGYATMGFFAVNIVAILVVGAATATTSFPQNGVPVTDMTIGVGLAVLLFGLYALVSRHSIVLPPQATA